MFLIWNLARSPVHVVPVKLYIKLSTRRDEERRKKTQWEFSTTKLLRKYFVSKGDVKNIKFLRNYKMEQ